MGTTIKEKLSTTVESPKLRRKLRAYRYIIGGLVILIPTISLISMEVRLLCVSLLGFTSYIVEGVGLANGISPEELREKQDQDMSEQKLDV